MKRIGILGGTFDPVHIGHTALANYIAQSGVVDEVWLTLSPQNPFKTGQHLTDDQNRMDMLRIATSQSPEIVRPCYIEMSMPRPSYTIDTLRTLSQRYPDYSFKLIIGGDNWHNFYHWRQYEAIIREFGVIIYPRADSEIAVDQLPDNVTIIKAPQIDVSSTWIRNAIANHRNINYFMPAGVYPYILEHKLYTIDHEH